MLPSGLMAAVTLGLFVWLESYRGSGMLYGDDARKLYLFFGLYWSVFTVLTLARRWAEVDDQDLTPVILGAALFLASGLGCLALWWRARRVAASRVGPGRSAELLRDPTDAPALLRVMDDWWLRAAADLTDAQRENLDAAQLEVIDALRERHLISRRQERRARRAISRPRWRESRR